MTMQRRHFELIAETIRNLKPDTYNPKVVNAYGVQWEMTARMFTDKLAATNPQFNRDRFLRACGVEG